MKQSIRHISQKLKKLALIVMLFFTFSPYIYAQNVLELVNQNATESYNYCGIGHNAYISFDVTSKDSGNIKPCRHSLNIKIALNNTDYPLNSKLDFNDKKWNIGTIYVFASNVHLPDDIFYFKFSGFMKILEHSEGTLKLAFDFRILDNKVISDTLNQFYKGERTFKRNDTIAITLLDSTTNNNFVLDDTHTKITAYDKSNKLLWQTIPQNDSVFQNEYLHNYRTDHPIIIYYSFDSPPMYKEIEPKKSKKVIEIQYNNSQTGCLDLVTGKFHFEGQD